LARYDPLMPPRKQPSHVNAPAPVDYRKLLESEIRKTGFVLENAVANRLKEEGWTVISGKYYIDDASEETVREIDLLAYRVSKFEQVDVYTVLIISCKKSDGNVWALLTRGANLNDPNTDWYPLHAWSNDPALSHQITRPSKARSYHDGVTELGAAEAVGVPKVDVFAFQEMSQTTGKPANDKAIFSAITTLVKAQAYELNVLPDRKKTASVYQFNLLSVVGSEMYRLMFDEAGDISCAPIESEDYLARYIVRKRDSFSRIRFVTESGLSRTLTAYRALHTANGKWFESEHRAFYADVLKDEERVRVLLAQFVKRIGFLVNWRAEKAFKGVEMGEPTLSWNAFDAEAKVGYVVPGDVIEWLNGHKEIRKRVGDALATIYRYTGAFSFEHDVPS
jgi:hypothetical protein